MSFSDLAESFHFVISGLMWEPVASALGSGVLVRLTVTTWFWPLGLWGHRPQASFSGPSMSIFTLGSCRGVPVATALRLRDTGEVDSDLQTSF